MRLRKRRNKLVKRSALECDVAVFSSKCAIIWVNAHDATMLLVAQEGTNPIFSERKRCSELFNALTCFERDHYFAVSFRFDPARALDRS